VALSATASDDVGVAGVQFKIDGANVSVEDTASPFAITWDSTTVSNGSHLVTAVARDTSSNTTTSSAVSVTVSNGGGGGSDFATRCALPGVLKCVSFDSAADFPVWKFGLSFGLSNGPTGNGPVLDTTVKASGNGSLRFTIPAGQVGGNGGQWFTNFTDDLSTLIGAGQEFWYQFRWRIDSNYLANGIGSWKVAAVTSGETTLSRSNGWIFSSCEATGITIQRVGLREFPEMYQSCTGSSYHGPYEGMTVQNWQGTGDFNLQNARPSPYCLYTQQALTPRPYPPPAGNCFVFYANEWMTWKVHVTVGALVGDGYPNSRIQLYMGREGQPTEPVIDFTMAINAIDPAFAGYVQKLGAVYFLPYTGTEVFKVTGSVWYDDLIISTKDIPDPGTGGTVSPPANVTLTRRRIQ
jgi:hypothetical protein